MTHKWLLEHEIFLWINCLTAKKTATPIAVLSRKLIVMAKVKITQVKSQIDRPQKQKDTLRAIGLRKVNQSVVKEVTPQLEGMIKKVDHLIKVEEA